MLEINAGGGAFTPTGEFDVIVDAANYITFRDSLYILKNTINSNIDYIYRAIDGMEEGWSGPTYETYKEKTQQYKHYLDALYDIVDIYSYMLDYQFIHGAYNTFLNAIEEADELLGNSADGGGGC